MTRALRLFTPVFGLVLLVALATLWLAGHGGGTRRATSPALKSSSVRLLVAAAGQAGSNTNEHVLVLEDRCRDRRAERRAVAGAAAQPPAAAPAPARTSSAPAPATITASTPATSAAASGATNIQNVIRSAFAPLGSSAVTWALRVSLCESGYNPRAVNVSSSAEGLFQFLPSTWATTPYAASSPFDPTANARAAAWLYAHAGPGQWACK